MKIVMGFCVLALAVTLSACAHSLPILEGDFCGQLGRSENFVRCDTAEITCYAMGAVGDCRWKEAKPAATSVPSPVPTK